MSNREYVRDFVVGMVMGAGLDLFMPVAGDGSLTNTVWEASLVSVPPSLLTLMSADRDKAMARGCAYAAGSVLGQFLYGYVSRT